VYASTISPHHSNITAVQPLAVDTVMTPRTGGQEPAIRNPPLSPPIPNQYGQYSPPRTVEENTYFRKLKSHRLQHWFHVCVFVSVV